MHDVQGLAQFDAERCRVFRRQRTPAQARIEGPAVDVFHYEECQPLFGQVRIVERDERVVIQRCEQTRFRNAASLIASPGGALQENLHSNGSTEPLIGGTVDRRHAARAHEFIEAIAPRDDIADLHTVHQRRRLSPAAHVSCAASDAPRRLPR